MNISRKTLTAPFFLFLLPLFFVFHGYIQNAASVALAETSVLAAEYFLSAGLLFCLGYLLYRKWEKAALLSFGLLFFHLFFGVFQDLLKKISPAFLAKYTVLLPLLFCLFVILLVVLKRSKNNFHRFFLYLNVIFLVLILVDVAAFLLKNNNSIVHTKFPVCTTCDKPDVYLIIADEYADSVSLAQAMQFDNGAFLAQLRNRGFYINEGSRSNYNFTPFVMASLFQMNYLQQIEGRNSSREDMSICESIINQNPVLDFFKGNGYEIKNFSIFNVDNQPTKVRQPFLLMGKDLITSQTFLKRLKKDLGYHLVTTLKLQSEIENYTYHSKQSNDKLLQLVQEEIQRKSKAPRFIYTHLLMPHYPYYYDKKGNLRPVSFFKKDNEFSKESYLEFMQYGNGVFLQLIDSILAHSSKPPVIIFMGDHGFREFKNVGPQEAKYFFMNMNSVYLPNQDYTKFYKNISSINQFRVLLNSVFDQRLPILKDSSSLLKE